MTTRTRWARTWPTLLAIGVVAAVGAPAAVASYRHARTVVERSGDPAMAPWLPLSVDGMLLAALAVAGVRRLHGDRAGVGPVVAFTLGMAVTLAANLAAAEQTVEGWLVALWPPVALAVTLEMVAVLLARSAVRPVTAEGPTPVEEVRPEPVRVEADRADEQVPAPELEAGSDPEDERSDPGDGEGPTTDEQIVAAIRAAVDGGRRPTQEKVRTDYGIGSRRARRLHREALGLDREEVPA